MDASRDLITIAGLIEADAERLALLRTVRETCGDEFWIGAGFVRNLVWSALHDEPSPCSALADIDVVWYDETRIDPDEDVKLQRRLQQARAAPWSVTNQARMHARNGHAPYRDLSDALAHWPETATAVACRVGDGGGLEVMAPCGTGDLRAGLIRPTTVTAGRPQVVLDRVKRKRWLEIWPRLRLCL